MSWVSLLLGTGIVLGGSGLAPVFASDSMIPVFKSTAYPGDVVTGGMLVDRQLPTTSPPKIIVTARQEIIGKMVKRTVIPGEPISADALREPYTVLQGKSVTLVAQASSLIITGLAVAVESGGTGDIVRARNPESGALVTGVVASDGTLRIDLR